MATVRLGRYEVEKYELPPVCAGCGAKAVVRRRKTFAWYPGWVIVLFFVASPLIAAIIAAALTKRMAVALPFCEDHRNYWRNRSLSTYLGLLAVILLAAGATALAVMFDKRGQDDLLAFACVGSAGLFLLWLVEVAIIHSLSIRPLEITDREIRLTRVSPYFVDAVDEDRRRGYDDEDNEDDLPRRKRPRDDDEAGRVRRKRDRDDDEDDRPRARRRAADEDDGGYYDPNAKRRDREDDEDDR
jgi:hypothetical protein